MFDNPPVVLPRLERMLANAAAERIENSAAASRRSRSRLNLPRIATVALIASALTGTAMAASGIWNPGIGIDAPIEGDGSALHGEGPATIVTTPVPAADSEALGVLRRDQNERDRSAEVEATLAGVSFVDRVRLDSVRFLAAGERGKATILLSAEQSIESGVADEELSICVFRPGAAGWGHVSDIVPSCFGAHGLLAGRAYSEEVNTPPGAGLAFGLVPDGVATVTAGFADAPDVTVPVTDNYFEVPMSGAQLDSGGKQLGGGVQRVVWHDSEGNIVPQLPGADSGEPSTKTERLTSGDSLAAETPGFQQGN